MQTADPSAISIRGLNKRYGSTTAVKDLNLEVRGGEIFGFIGLNGAGKTTTIRILLDLLRPTSGHALVFGHDCQKGLQARSLVGYLPGEMGVYSDMTGSAMLDFLAAMSGREVRPAYRRELEARFELPTHDLHRKLREYSTGMKRKMGLIQAFQSDPPLLILDEPTEGLDPLMQEAFYALLASIKAKGRTIFMSSHVLSEVERVCDRIALLRKGELVLLSTVEEARKLAARRIRIWFQNDVGAVALPSGHTMIDAQPRQWTVQVEGELGPLLLLAQPLGVKDIAIDEPKLEDVLVKYYRDGAA